MHTQRLRRAPTRVGACLFLLLLAGLCGCATSRPYACAQVPAPLAAPSPLPLVAACLDGG